MQWISQVLSLHKAYIWQDVKKWKLHLFNFLLAMCSVILLGALNRVSLTKNEKDYEAIIRQREPVDLNITKISRGNLPLITFTCASDDQFCWYHAEGIMQKVAQRNGLNFTRGLHAIKNGDPRPHLILENGGSGNVVGIYGGRLVQFQAMLDLVVPLNKADYGYVGVEFTIFYNYTTSRMNVNYTLYSQEPGRAASPSSDETLFGYKMYDLNLLSLAVQSELEQSIMEFSTDREIDQVSYRIAPFQSLYDPSAETQALSSSIPSQLCRILLVLSPLLAGIASFYATFSEKRSGRYSLLKRLGLYESVFWLSRLLPALRLAFFGSMGTCMGVLMSRLWFPIDWQYPMLTQTTNLGVIFALQMCAVFSLTSFLLFFTSISNRPSFGNVVAGIAFTLVCNMNVIPYLIPQTEFDAGLLQSRASLLYYLFLPWTSFGKCYADLMRIGRGYKVPDSNGNVISYYGFQQLTMPYKISYMGSSSYIKVESTATTLLRMFAGCLVYFLMAWYLNQTLSQDERFKLCWYFPFTKSYWLNSASRGRRENIAKLFNDLLDRSRSQHSLIIHKLSKIFKGSGSTALKEISVEFQPGKVYAILGHNGAGKSTLVRLITGEVNPTYGQAFLNGFSLLDDLKQILPQIGCCAQEDILWDHLTPVQHIELVSGLRGKRFESRERFQEYASELLDSVNLSKVSEIPVSSFSGGMKRRLSLILSVIPHCSAEMELLVLDEPTTGMDPVNRRACWKVIEQHKQNKIVILTTHSMEEADELCDEICVINSGKMKALGTSVFLKRHFADDGFRMRLATNDSSQMLDSVRLYLPRARIVSNVCGSLTLHLPHDSIKSIPAFLESLNNDDDTSGDKQMVEWEVSSATLDQVFLKICEQDELQTEQKHSQQSSLSQHTFHTCSLCGEQHVDEVQLFTANGIPITVAGLLCSKCATDSSQQSITHSRPRQPLFTVDSSASTIWCDSEGTSTAGHVIVAPEQEMKQNRHNNDDYVLCDYQASAFAQIRAVYVKNWQQFTHRRIATIIRVLLSIAILATVIVLLKLVIESFTRPCPQGWLRMGSDLNCDDYHLIGLMNSSMVAKHLSSRFGDNGESSFAQAFEFYSADPIDRKRELDIIFSSTGDREMNYIRDMLGNFTQNESTTVALRHSLNSHGGLLYLYAQARIRERLMEQISVGGAVGSEKYFKCQRRDYYTTYRYLQLNSTSEIIGNLQNFPMFSAHFESLSNSTFSWSPKQCTLGYHAFKSSFVHLSTLDRSTGQCRYSNYRPNPMALQVGIRSINALRAAQYGVPVEIYAHSVGHRNFMPVALDDGFYVTTTKILGILLVIAAFHNACFFTLRSMVGSISVERDDGMFQMMRLNGIRAQHYWIGTLLWYALLAVGITLPAALIMFAIGAADTVIGTLEHPVNIILFVLALMCFINAQLSYSVLLASCLRRNVSAVIVGNLVQLLIANGSYLILMVGAEQVVQWDSTYALSALTPLTLVLAVCRLHTGRPVGELFLSLFISTLVSVVLLLLGIYFNGGQGLLGDPSKSLKHLFKQLSSSITRRHNNDYLTVNSTDDHDDDDTECSLSVSGICKQYSGKTVVDNVSFKVLPGKVFALLGPNGAGKSTLVRLLSGCEQMDSGSIRLNNLQDGSSILLNQETFATLLTTNISKFLSICPQHDLFFDDLTVRDHLMFYARAKGCPGKHLQTAIYQAAEHVGLDGDAMSCVAQQLSGGMKRRLSIAITLLSRAPLLVLDEPSSGLDPRHRMELWKIIDKVTTDKTRSVVVITHSMYEAEALADRIAIMSNGRIQCIGSPASLKDQYGSGCRLVCGLQFKYVLGRRMLKVSEGEMKQVEQLLLLKLLDGISKIIGHQLTTQSAHLSSRSPITSSHSTYNTLVTWSASCKVDFAGFSDASALSRIIGELDEFVVLSQRQSIPTDPGSMALCINDWVVTQSSLEDAFVHVTSH